MRVPPNLLKFTIYFVGSGCQLSRVLDLILLYNLEHCNSIQKPIIRCLSTIPGLQYRSELSEQCALNATHVLRVCFFSDASTESTRRVFFMRVLLLLCIAMSLLCFVNAAAPKFAYWKRHFFLPSQNITNKQAN